MTCGIAETVRVGSYRRRVQYPRDLWGGRHDRVFDSLGNAIVDRSPDELIGAVVIALIIASRWQASTASGDGKSPRT